MIVIVDYDTGNTRNLKKALDYLNVPNQLSADPATILAADGIILPGVGAFQKAMLALQERQLISVLQTAAAKGQPMLGICLGMQLLFETGYEFGEAKGLGILPGEIVPLPEKDGYKVPHMGWNTNTATQSNRFGKIFDQQATYFVHSYYAQTSARNIVAQTDYSVEIPSIVQQNNVIGMQFHPEKSGAIGLKGLNAFKEMALDERLSRN
ncbi:imidazole glycerol phosphate synthase subunit HisH [Loigolactobacillus backii]|uniref:Imidazole glycerol phosphate synthase subunit HisH n=1 Tax=Loigolactobacillus backii TaxID=375175 RepID=A0A192GYP4_9LACO|nr:imidazole glycerol phosphate synthase subunit HisH [Loigolactobacillus backii]ANK60785.1 imidazole glycerol phosphate synthase, glutamine amidotransferase subunit [Loigolactobacillus backii]ANK61644.1 imidazole glycerol phosphate synthase, glutamine amidotransferase subunit [Loigolactobacillus backii]ANK65739.1 imidazole glycerol phosphate synthase, glutamine amidotransferase subunit [Loigolactobacillus backii]ANK68215.1 imidazole glycerol phosphate synthase, glutamine amidotransferase subun